MKRATCIAVVGLVLVSICGCDRFSKPTISQCEEAVDGAIPDAYLEAPGKELCEQVLEFIHTAPLKADKQDKHAGLVGKLTELSNNAAVKVTGGLLKFSDDFKESVKRCEESWSLATAQCVMEQIESAPQDKSKWTACFVAAEVLDQTCNDALVGCDNDWSLAMVRCLEETSNRADIATCKTWPWSDADPALLILSQEHSAEGAMKRAAAFGFTKADIGLSIQKYLSGR